MPAAAKQGDRVTATDMHLVVMPGTPPTMVPQNLPFNGKLQEALSSNVRIMGRAAAVVGSIARNAPPHLPPPGQAFQSPPANQGSVAAGSATVRINGKPAARDGDSASTCNDLPAGPPGRVVAQGSVRIG